MISRYIAKPIPGNMKWGIYPIHLDDKCREYCGNVVAECDTRKEAWGHKQKLNRKAEKALAEYLVARNEKFA